MSVVGFDIGNDNCVIAIAKHKAIQILQNDVSKYETPSVVSFTKDRRQIGSAGASSAGMYPKSTISQIKRLIGQNYDDPGMADEFKLLPFRTTRGADGGILIEIDYLKKTEFFTPVEILAMLLSHLKQMTEISGDGAPVVDCVIGIPSYFNDFQRVAYLNAADIAGLNPFRLIHDGTATAIGYGYVNPDIKSPTILVFVDVGHCDTQVTVAKFEDKKVTILAHSFDWNLGGRDFDRILYEYFAEEFKKKYSIDIDVDDNNSHHKARVRLMAACEKVKKLLTANREANIGVDCLVDGKDLVGSIKREEFENLSKDLLERVVKTCGDALMDVDGKLTKSDIHSVELVGSGSRIPAIGSSICQFFDNKPPNRTLNGSECVARGCALQGVIFRSGDNNRGYAYEVQDSIPLSVTSTVRQKSIESIQNRLPHGSIRDDSRAPKKSVKRRNLSTSELPTAEGAAGILDQFSEVKHSVVLFEKCLQFPCPLHFNIPDACQDFRISTFNEYRRSFPPNASQRSRHFQVDASQMVSLWNPSPVTVKICINLHGVVVVESAKIEGKSLFWGKSSDIKIFETSRIGMTQKSIHVAKGREKDLLKWDALVEAVQHEKNALETFIYDTRNKLQGRYLSFVKVTEKERISQKLDKAETLINDEGDYPIDTYTKNLLALQQLVNPIESRCKHFEACTQAMKKLEDSVSNQIKLASTNFAKSYNPFFEELLSTIQKLQKILPKNIEQLPVLVEKIKKITDRIDENNYLVEDVSTIREKYANLFREVSMESLSAHHENKLNKSSYLVEEDRGQAVAPLLYTIFDTRVEMIYLKCLYIDINGEIGNLLEKVSKTCDCIEKNCEKWMPQDFSSDNINITQKELDRAREVIQHHVTSKEAHIRASKNSGKLNPQGPSTNKETIIEEAEEDKCTDLQAHLLEIEKQLSGRYWCFLRSEEEKRITELIRYLRRQKDVGNNQHIENELHKILDSIKERYQEYENKRSQAVGMFYECITEIRSATRSMPNNVINGVLKRCTEEENWLKRTFPKLYLNWMVSDNKPFSSEIRKRMESFKTSCQDLLQALGVEQQIHNPNMRGQHLGLRAIGKAPSTQLQMYTYRGWQNAVEVVGMANCQVSKADYFLLWSGNPNIHTTSLLL